MKYCPNCQMKVQNQLNHCPLCGHILDSIVIEVERDYPKRFARGVDFQFENQLSLSL